MRTLTTVTLSISLLAGCTTWGTTTVLGPRREVGRQLRGMPSYATTSSSSLSAGFAGARSQHVAVAGLDAGTESFSRTHCVQEADVSYEQPFEVQPVIRGRPNDVVGGVLLGIAGLTIMGIAQARAHTIFKPGDPLYQEPPSAMPGTLLGGAFLAGGVGVVLYSFGKLPKEPKPEIREGVNRWVASEIVESDGCAPGDPSIAQRTQGATTARAAQSATANTRTQQSQDTEVEARLKTLDRLKASGTINDKEYQRKRAEILDGI
jgi:hypothetical protein